MKYRITFILALKDRHEETVNWIKNNIYKDFYYIILDGSLSNFNQKIFSKISLANLEYIRCKKDTNVKNYYSKLFFASKKIKTDYVMQVDNDDYINPLGINEIISFLDKNKNIDFSQGYISGVHKLRNKYYISDYKENDCNHIKSTDSKIKIIRLLSNYRILWYSVYRKNLFKIVNKKTNEFVCKNYVNNELLHALLSLSYGNFKFLNCISYIRRTNPIFSSYKSVTQKMMKYNKYDLSRIFKLIEKINNFKTNSLPKIHSNQKKKIYSKAFYQKINFVFYKKNFFQNKYYYKNK